jgi:hypothetical protein
MNIKNIKTFTTFFLASGIFVSPLLANPKLEQAILKEINQNTEITAQEIKDASVDKCFAGPIYTTIVDMLKKSHNLGALYGMKDDGVVEITDPGSNEEMPKLQSIVNPEFRLKTKEDGEHLINAMHALYERAFIIDKVEPHFVQNGLTWSMIIGEMREDFHGFIFETNADGKITKISRSLEIKK